MLREESYLRMFASLYYIATHNSALREQVASYLNERFPDDPPAALHQVTRYVHTLRENFGMRITWSSRTGYKIRFWGIIDQTAFFAYMAKDLNLK